jgi:cytochrome c oxidase subunit 2
MEDWYMGLGLLLVIWIITFASSYFFIAKTWWFPPLASAGGGAIDHEFAVTMVAMGVVFITAQAGLGLFVWRYRDRGAPGKAHYSHGSTRLEVLWTTLTAVLFLGLALLGSRIWAAERFQPARPGDIQVEVTGVQFAWYFRYPGPDGQYGQINPKLIDASLGGAYAVGLDPADPASKDDLVSGTLVLPVNRQVEVTLRSQDVIHSFFVPDMRFKQDAVPGLKVQLHFTPDKIGNYEIACAELCGLGHYKMHAMMRVVSEQDYAAWLKQREAEKQ